MTEVDVSVIIPTYNRKDLLRQTLASLAAYEHRGVRAGYRNIRLSNWQVARRSTVR